MRFTFIQMEKAVYSLCILCRVMQGSRSGYYKWLGRTRSARAIRDAELTTKIRAIHNHSKQTYGSPRIHAELREEGTPISRKRVARIMRQESIAGVPRKRYRHTTDSNHKYAIASNLLNRTFDVTHVWTWEGSALSCRGHGSFFTPSGGMGSGSSHAHRAGAQCLRYGCSAAESSRRNYSPF